MGREEKLKKEIVDPRKRRKKRKKERKKRIWSRSVLVSWSSELRCLDLRIDWWVNHFLWYISILIIPDSTISFLLTAIILCLIIYDGELIVLVLSVVNLFDKHCYRNPVAVFTALFDFTKTVITSSRKFEITHRLNCNKLDS